MVLTTRCPPPQQQALRSVAAHEYACTHWNMYVSDDFVLHAGCQDMNLLNLPCFERASKKCTRLPLSDASPAVRSRYIAFSLCGPCIVVSLLQDVCNFK